MKLYNPNENFYDHHVEGYTSDDEFIINTRVHENNEMPPYDIFDTLHSLLRNNDGWEWFVGSSFIVYDNI
jgi:hypothetical protein